MVANWERRLMRLVEKTLEIRLVRFVLILALLSLVIALTLKVYYISADYDAFAKDQRVYFWNAPFWDRYVKELDIAGLLGGLLSIVISIWITLVIEKGNQSKQQESEKQTNEIVGKITSIYEREKQFFAHDSTPAIFSAISRIIKNAVEKKQNIHIMTHQGLIPRMLGYRAHTILEQTNKNINDLENLSKSDWFREEENYVRRLGALEEELFQAARALQSCDPKRNVYFKTLNPSSIKKEYVSHVLEGGEVIFYDENSVDPIFDFKPDVTEVKDLDGIYLIPNTKGGKSDDECKVFLTEFISKKQQRFVDNLRGQNIVVELTDNINQDVYLSEIGDTTNDGSCLFFVQNKRTLTNDAKKLLCFEIQKEKYVTDSFIKIINATK